MVFYGINFNIHIHTNRKQIMKAPLNTNDWSGSIKSKKAPLNTDDWSGFISAEMANKLSNTCQCITTPCNCGVVLDKEIQYDNSIKDTVTEPTIGGSDLELIMMEKSKAKANKKNYLMYGLIAVAGYFAYMKFKK